MTRQAYWKEWAKRAGIRAIKTMAQTALGIIGTTILMSDLNCLEILSASILAGIVSLLTSIAGLPEVHIEEGNKCSWDVRDQ